MIDNLMAQKKNLKGKLKLDSLNGIAKQSNSVFTLIWKYFFFYNTIGLCSPHSGWMVKCRPQALCGCVNMELLFMAASLGTL